MQLPGLATDPVRLSLDLTWDPVDCSFSMSRRLWTRPARGHSWELEDMACSGTPIRAQALPARWAAAADLSLKYFVELTEAQDPF